MTTQNFPSKYEITWIEFRTETGIATKKDIQKIAGRASVRDIHTGCYYRWFRSKAKAVEFLQNFNKELSKRYSCRLLCDKQFGSRKKDNNYEIVFTKKQMEEVYYV